MNSFFWFDTIKHGIFHYTYLGVSGYNFQKDCIILPKDLFFTFTNYVDSDDMQHYAAFHLSLYVCKSTHFGGSRIQRFKLSLFYSHATTKLAKA